MQRLTFKRTLWVTFLLIGLLLLPALGVSAAPPAPSFGTATVDGQINDWNLAQDFFADMYRAGKSDANHPVESKLYLRYDCDAEVLYVLVITESETANVLLENDKAFVKLGKNDKLVDGSDENSGTVPNFAWYGVQDGKAAGFEASAPLTPGNYNNLNVHVQVFSDNESQTSVVLDRAIDLNINCDNQGGNVDICPSSDFWMSEYNLITIANLSTSSDVEYKTFVGGSLTGTSSQNFGIHLDQNTFPANEPSLEVAGGVFNGAAVNVNAGSVAVNSGNTVVFATPNNGYTINGRTFNINQGNSGASAFVDANLPTKAATISADIQAWSTLLSGLGTTPGNTATIPGSPSALNFEVNAVDANGVAVFNVNGNQVFNNGNVQQIEIKNNINAGAIIINVSGTSINWNHGNMVGSWLTSLNGRSKTVWNFYEATSLNLTSKNFMGVLLAPLATVTSSANIDGATAVKVLSTSSEVHKPLLDLDCQPPAETGSIKVIKQANPADGTDFAFTMLRPGDSPVNVTLDDDSDPTRTDNFTVSNLEAGQYTILEAPVEDWQLTSVDCGDASTADAVGGIAVNLAAGENVTCTFTNTQLATILVQKEVPDGEGDPNNPNQTFTLNITNFDDVDAGSSNVTDGSGFIGLGDLLPDTYTVREQNIPEGWTLDNISCVVDEGNTSVIGAFTPGDTSLEIDLHAGDRVACTFTNSFTSPASITIEKVTDPVNTNQTFPFTSDLGSFNLGSGGSKTFSDLEPGEYTFTEGSVSDWKLTDLTCDSENITRNGTSLTIDLQGEDVTCTFTNSQLGVISFKKIVPEGEGDPDTPDQKFNITATNGSRTFGSGNVTPGAGPVGREDLEPGTWTIRENSIPEGWTLDNIVCTPRGASTADTFQPGDTSLVMNLVANDRIDCVFTNSYDPPVGTITIVKVTDPVNTNQTFPFTSDLGSFELGSGGSTTFEDLEPGGYTFTEGSVSDWKLTDLTCDSDNVSKSGTGVTVNVAAYEHITCTFTNSQLGVISFKKVVPEGEGDPNTPDQKFSISATNGSRTFGGGNVTPGAGPVGREDLEPGTWTIRENNIPEGWTLDNIVCTPRGASTADTFQPGDTSLVMNLVANDRIDCVFTNSYEPPKGSITVIKEVAVGDESTVFNFGFFSPPNFSNEDPFTLSAQDNPVVFGDLDAGTYAVAEYFKSGWKHVEEGDVVCISDGDSTFEFDADSQRSGPHINLAIGDDVTCTFTNTKLYSDLTAKKVNNTNGVGAVGVPFNWTITLTNEGDANATFTNDQIVLVDNLPVGPGYPAYPTIANANGLSGGVNCTITNSVLQCAAVGSLTFDPGGHFDLVISTTPDAAGTLNNPTNGVCEIDPNDVIEESNEDNNSCSDVVEVEAGTITIIKDVVYNADIDTDSDRDFGYVSTKLGNFTLDDPLTEDNDGITNTAVFSDLAPGEYTIIESLNGDWDQTVECVGDAGVSYLNPDTGATIDLDNGEDVVCTFTNTRVTYELTYEKVVIGEPIDGDWDFTLATLVGLLGPIDEDFGVVAHAPGIGGEGTTLTLPLDAYSVGEIVPEGYDLKRIDCGDGGLSVEYPENPNFTIILDQDLTCTFTNEAQSGKLTIVKDAVPDSATNFRFEGSFGIFTLDDDDDPNFPNSLTFGNLDTETDYSVTEKPNANWYLTGIQCEAADESLVDANIDLDARTVSVDLLPGQHVTCTFTNEQGGRIRVRKYEDTNENGSRSGNEPWLAGWEFTLYDSGENVVDAKVTNSNGALTFGGLDEGTYTVCETDARLAGDWVNSEPGTENPCYEVEIAFGEISVVNFGNYELGTITVIKDVVYEADVDIDSDRDFGYFSTELGNFTLDDPLVDDADGITNTAVFSDLTAGEYTIIENPNGNWNQTVECVGDDGVSYLNPDTGATIDLNHGEDVVCTFTNTRVTYELTYKKVVIGEPIDGDWEFTLATLVGLLGPVDEDFGVVAHAPGVGGEGTTLTLPLDAYSVGEIVPEGYDLKRIDCGDGGLSVEYPEDPNFTIILDQDLTCTFTNEAQPGKLTIVKDAVPDAATNFRFEGSFGIFTLDDDDDPNFPNSLTFGNLDTETDYTVTEQERANWYLTDIQCEAADESPVDANIDLDGRTVSVDLLPGQHVTCTFTNEQGGRIAVRKYEDLNENGSRSGNEPWLAGWEFTLYDSSENVVDTKVTNGNGALTFGGLDEGSYTVCETDARLSDGWVNSEPGGPEACYDVQVTYGVKAVARFGNYALPGSIKVIKAVNWGENGVDDTQEFELCVDGDCQTVGYNGGEVIFTDLPYGEYTVSETDPGEDWIVEGEGVVVVNPGKQTEVVITNTDDRPVCDYPGDPDADLRNEWTFIEDPDGTLWLKGQVTNTSEACGYDVGMASYKMYENSLFSQELIDSDLGHVGPESTIHFEVEIMECAAQVDLFYGDLIEQFVPGVNYGSRLLDALYINWGDWCEPDTMDVSVTKIVDWGNYEVNINQTFDICITGPSYPNGVCKTVDYDGGVATWTDLEPGEYTAWEQNPGEDWNVSGWGSDGEFTIQNTYNPVVEEPPQDNGGNDDDDNGMGEMKPPVDNNPPSNGGGSDDATADDRPECTDPNAGRDLKHGGSHLTSDSSGVIVNLSDSCAYEVGMASYQMVDNTTDNQIIFDSVTRVIEPGQTLNLSVSLPSCATQVDLFYGSLIPDFVPGLRYGDRLIEGRYLGWGNWCGVKPQ